MVSGICVAESIDGGRAALVFLGTITLGQIVVWAVLFVPTWFAGFSFCRSFTRPGRALRCRVQAFCSLGMQIVWLWMALGATLVVKTWVFPASEIRLGSYEEMVVGGFALADIE